MEKKPFITLEQAQRIIADVPTPFHIYDEKGIRENARLLNKAFAWNKGYKEYFAVKATPNPYILKILQEEGCGVDCSSYTELMLAEACGFSGQDIMFSSNVTPVEDMQLAARLGAYINLDDYTHVEFLERVAGIPETICCRYNPGGVFSMGNDIMDNPGEAKYGMTEQQMVDAYKKLMAKGARHFGIHAFLASNTVSNEYYPTLAGILFELAVRLKEATGAHISFINLSGGVGVDYRPEQPANDIMVIGEGVRRKFEEILVPAGMGDVAIFTELGRFMLAPYGHLVSTVLHEKHTYKDYIGLDACAANLMRPAMYGSYHHITVLGKENAPCDHRYDVTGGLCENNDKFAIDRMLPEIQIGDILVLHDTGAHGFSMGYNYNGKLRSAEVLLREDGSHKLIRRAETPEDYFATFDFTPFFKK
ncbi:diaminopimelate decarboxylase [Gemmiger formicilis]|uniref:diaminopimelate decarboxylase n=1 Tax=Gemmiger formicilis TaxID=745368 RepID=UPI00195821DE|nr:diaminopimelate decarboxylase [Gemmiger formicilis]MBM6915015.1 diaminopimelate decarboxylase [Gemmiger formicilis]